MNTSNTACDEAATEVEINLDLTALLGSGQVFAAGADRAQQIALIDANCNKIGFEGGCCGGA